MFERKEFLAYHSEERYILTCVEHGIPIVLSVSTTLKSVLENLCQDDYNDGQPPIKIKNGTVYGTTYFPEQMPRGKYKRLRPSLPDKAKII